MEDLLGATNYINATHTHDTVLTTLYRRETKAQRA